MAHGADSHILYDATSGKLFYDADGNGTQAAVLIATLAPATTLHAGDLFII